MTFRRRIMISGGVGAALYVAVFIVFLSALDHDVSSSKVVPALLAGATLAFIVGSFLFGFVPHLMGSFMAEANSALDVVNRVSLAVALISIAVGVLCALAMIGGVATSAKPLLVAITFFLGSAATMCSLKFFYINRAQE